MLRKAFLLLVLLTLLIAPLNAETQANQSRWSLGNTYEISSNTLTVYSQPDIHSQPAFHLYKGMDIKPSEIQNSDGYKWFKLANKNYWVPALEPGGITHLIIKTSTDANYIEDYYGVLEMPHNFAVKMVKYAGAKGHMEIYKKVGEEYALQSSYDISYRKDGEKDEYGDLKTVGGNVVRYMYRTTRSSMNGWDASGDKFGVFKTSYPMPHDGLPHLLEGHISTYQYNKLPAINQHSNGEFYPHPGSYMGADIVLHTKRKGSRGCINIENEAMAYLYHEDMATELDREIIPLVIYDEDVIAPPIGQLI